MSTKSSSSSTTSTSSTNQQFDERIAADNQSIVIRLDENNALTVNDLSPQTFEGALEFAGDVISGGADFLSDQLGEERKLIEASLGLVERRTQSEAANLQQDIVKFGAVVAAGVVKRFK